MLAIFRKKFSSPSFLPCSSIFSHCSFMIFFSLAMAWLLISALSLRYFSFSCNTLWNSVGEISPSCIAYKMILAMLSNLPWESSLMESYFSRATIEAIRYFRVAGVIGEKSGRTLLKTIQTGSPTPFASAAMDIHPVRTVDVIRPVSLMLNIVIDCLIFLAFFSHFSISSKKNASILDNLFNRYVCGSACGAVGFKSGLIFVSLSYMLILYLIAGDRMSLG